MINGQQSKSIEVLYGITLGVLIPHCFSWSISMTLAFLPSFYTQDSLLMILQLLYRSISSNQRAENLRNELNAPVTWATIWQLSWSLKKCNVLRITRSNRPITYNYIAQGSSIPLVSHHPYFGVELTSDLSWKWQIKMIKKTANQTLAFLRWNLI